MHCGAGSQPTGSCLNHFGKKSLRECRGWGRVPGAVRKTCRKARDAWRRRPPPRLVRVPGRGCDDNSPNAPPTGGRLPHNNNSGRPDERRGQDRSAQPHRNRRFRVRRIHRADAGRHRAAAPAVHGHGLHRNGQAPLQAGLAVPAERHQFRPQRQSHRPCPRLRREARAERLRHGLPGEERGPGRRLCRAAGRHPGRQPRQLRRAEHPLRRGYRRILAVSSRSLRRQDHLRRRLRIHRGPQAGRQRRRPAADRPPDPQRQTRADGRLVRLLRAHRQLPRDPLLRHRGQAHRPVLPRHDRALRQDPHPDQRVGRRQVADRGIHPRVPRRGHPAHRHEHRRYLRHRAPAARQRRGLHDHSGYLLCKGRQPRGWPWRAA